MIENSSDKDKVFTKADVVKAVASASRRIALIHLAYSKAIIDELGKESGTKLISKAIRDYGSRIGEKTRKEVLGKGLEAIPENFGKGESYAIPSVPGMHDHREKIEMSGVQRNRAHGCVLAKTWQDCGEPELGRLYCYMDVAKYMAYNPNFKYVHVKKLIDGDPYCEFEIKPTTEQERKDFSDDSADWFYIDK